MVLRDTTKGTTSGATSHYDVLRGTTSGTTSQTLRDRHYERFCTKSRGARYNYHIPWDYKND